MAPRRRLALALAACALGFVAGPADAQIPGTRFSLGQGPAVVTIDQERLFARSAFGQAVTAAVEDAVRTLSERNRSLERTLAEEEQALTERRPTLPAEEFRTLADAFDARVEEIRRTQEARGRAIAAFREAQQQAFFEAALPVMMEVVQASGAVAVLDSRALVLALDSIDITDRILARIDTVLGPDDVPDTLSNPGAQTTEDPPSPRRPLRRPAPPAGGPPLDLPSPTLEQ